MPSTNARSLRRVSRITSSSCILRFVFLLSTAALLLAGCTIRRTYDVQGRIVGFGDDGQTVIIEHEAVPNLMDAMTMPFKVRDTTTLQAFSLRDALRFQLVLTRNGSWIEDLVRLPDSAVAAHPAGETDPAFSSSPDVPLLTPGDLIPPFTLTNQHGETITSEGYEGHALLLTFIYTRCPLPDYCPLLSQQFKVLQPQLTERYGNQVQQLSISFDPAHDTPEVLKAYAGRFTANTEQWTFATGTPQDIARLAQAFGVFYEEEGVEFTHNLATALVDGEGRVYQIWRGNDWRPEEVLQTIEAMYANSLLMRRRAP